MAQQQQNITLSAPGFQGINTEDSPLQQEPGFCLVADNAVVDNFGRIGCRKAFAEFTTAVNVTYSVNGSTDSTEIITHRMGNGIISNVSNVLAVVGVYQYDVNGALIQSDYRVCKLTTVGDVHELDEVALPTVIDPSALTDAKIVSFRDQLFIFSQGNDVLVYDGAVLTNLSAAAGYLAPQDDTGTLAPLIDGAIVTASYGRLWATGVNDDFNTIYYSDLLIPTQWYDGKAVPTDPLNTGGILDVAEYWPNGTDRIVNIVAHNNALYVFGRNSILIYNNAASGDPAGADGIFLADAISNIGLVSRDAVANIGSDVLFVDDSGVRSLGRTIQEKSVPLGDLTYNVRKDVTFQIASTVDKNSISLSFWPDEDLAVLIFSDDALAYTMEMRAPSQTGGSKITRWTGCDFERALYYEVAGEARVLLASNKAGGLYLYGGFIDYSNNPYEFSYESTVFTFGQPANLKFLRQIDYTIVSSTINTTAVAEWGYSGKLDYSKQLSVAAQAPALFGVAEFNVGEFGDGLTTIRRYKVNTKGSGETVIIGIRANINGNGFSLQELNIQTLLGRMN
jgi:hypothetical protein